MWKYKTIYGNYSICSDGYVGKTTGVELTHWFNGDGNIFIFWYDSQEVELLHNSLQEMLMKYFPPLGGYYV